MIERQFADGRYKFEIGFDEATEWERIRGRSLYLATGAMTKGTWLLADVYEVVRLALIGGGTEPTKAASLCDYYLKKQPLTVTARLAIDILDNAFFGVEDEPEDDQPTVDDGFGNQVAATE